MKGKAMENKVLGIEKEWLIDNKGIHTASEIAGQPTLWLATWEALNKQSAKLVTYLKSVLSHEPLDIILTGAGTSAFIGEVLVGTYKNAFDKDVRAISTTDLMTFPDHYLSKEKPTLLISFARSGNSPESVGVVDIANQYCKNIFHLIITCNQEGALAKQYHGENVFTFILPPQSNDKSLAMTGSFTSMLLSGLMISKYKDIASLKNKVKSLAETATFILEQHTASLKKVAQLGFERAVFLGSGPLLGIATEGHLKVQELTDGKVVCKNDSYLGFRHGPKAVINPTSLIVYHFSNNEYVRQFENDLVKDIDQRKDGLFRLGIGIPNQHQNNVDLLIDLPGCEAMDDAWMAVCSILPDQILAFHKCIQVGLSPDEPSVSGNIARVVQGVIIYPFQANVEV
jgi:tagatose-6-phosphate ketose/aldose isomerase